MKDNQKEPQTKPTNFVDEESQGIFGMDPETSLLSVNFAPEGNSLLNIDYQNEIQEKP